MTAQAGSASFPATRSDRDLLRRDLRLRRRQLSTRQRTDAAAQFAAVAVRARLLRPQMRLALYMPHGGEADPSALLLVARALHCSVHVPIITNHRESQMSFVPLGAGDVWTRNRYGILEPRRRAQRVPIRYLDLIVLPLVAVDESGWRVGSGAGFYDRCLRHLRSPRLWRRPKLIGLAYDFQRVPRIMPQPWDVPVDAVLSESGLYPARRASATSSPRTWGREARIERDV